LLPPSVDLNSAASSTPAYTVSGSCGEHSRCHTRLNSHGCGEPSYQRCVVSGAFAVSYAKMWLSAIGKPFGVTTASPGGVPGRVQVLPPSSERWMIWPNHEVFCDT